MSNCEAYIDINCCLPTGLFARGPAIAIVISEIRGFYDGAASTFASGLIAFFIAFILVYVNEEAVAR